MSVPQTTLITGFGAFGNVVNNPTERLVRHFSSSVVPGHSVTTCVLPVSYARAPAMLMDAIKRGDPSGRPFDLVWMLGVASNSAHWRVERFGRNLNGSGSDADGDVPAPYIVRNGPEAIESSVPIDALAAALTEAGIPAVVSDSAGSYLCNHILYTALWRLGQECSTARVGFLHVPADPKTHSQGKREPTGFPFDQHIRAVELSLAVLAAHPGRRSRFDGSPVAGVPPGSRAARSAQI